MPEAKSTKPAVKAATKTKKAEKAPKPVDNTVYIDSGLYNPKAEHTVASWQEVQALLPCTYSALEAAGKNHKNQGFLPYLKTRNAIVPEGTDISSLKPAPKPKKEKAVKAVPATKAKAAA